MEKQQTFEYIEIDFKEAKKIHNDPDNDVFLKIVRKSINLESESYRRLSKNETLDEYLKYYKEINY